MAWSQLTFCHWPVHQLERVFQPPLAVDELADRRAFAQCVPRLIGLSQDGSWPTHTPFTTSP
jgi:uncharacterized protein YqjF (DUF2071 family)